ncbi:probable ATP-dependent helicase PF08_0048 [Trichoplusia ni]|uniref:Probable ATP-dependent helicase PF08_0048 n=1 Tax=Trichoplusia ni TaxID=7111 RepID=A0A7E5VJV8_TRINI|nr:probable ATP-dependent helicase PF08_0048 [Trichoplusia ni]
MTSKVSYFVLLGIITFSSSKPAPKEDTFFVKNEHELQRLLEALANQGKYDIELSRYDDSPDSLTDDKSRFQLDEKPRKLYRSDKARSRYSRGSLEQLDGDVAANLANLLNNNILDKKSGNKRISRNDNNLLQKLFGLAGDNNYLGRGDEDNEYENDEILTFLNNLQKQLEENGDYEGFFRTKNRNNRNDNDRDNRNDDRYDRGNEARYLDDGDDRYDDRDDRNNRDRNQDYRDDRVADKYGRGGNRAKNVDDRDDRYDNKDYRGKNRDDRDDRDDDRGNRARNYDDRDDRNNRDDRDDRDNRNDGDRNNRNDDARNNINDDDRKNRNYDDRNNRDVLRNRNDDRNDRNDDDRKNRNDDDRNDRNDDDRNDRNDDDRKNRNDDDRNDRNDDDRKNRNDDDRNDDDRNDDDRKNRNDDDRKNRDILRIRSDDYKNYRDALRNRNDLDRNDRDRDTLRCRGNKCYKRSRHDYNDGELRFDSNNYVKKYKLNEDTDAVVLGLTDVDRLLTKLNAPKPQRSNKLRAQKLLENIDLDKLLDRANKDKRSNVEAVVFDLTKLEDGDVLAKQIQRLLSKNDQGLDAEYEDYGNFVEDNLKLGSFNLKKKAYKPRSDSKIVAHSEDNNNVYVPKWLLSEVLSKSKLRDASPIQLLKSVLPLTKQKKSRVMRIFDKKDLSTLPPKKIFRRNFEHDVGVPFHLEVEGLGQVKP